MHKTNLVKKLHLVLITLLLFLSVSCSSLNAKEEGKNETHPKRSFGGYHPHHHGPH